VMQILVTRKFWFKALAFASALAISALVAPFTNIAMAETWTKMRDDLYCSSLINSPIGLLLGEFDTSLRPSSYNGVIVSKDLGNTWTNLGLGGQAVTGLAYYNGEILATTYFVKDDLVGLYISRDNGITWNHAGPVMTGSAVARNSSTIFLGGSNNGLWISKDDGLTFTQKIGTGYYGPNVVGIGVSESVAVVGTVSKTYISWDQGDSWQEVPELNNIQAKYFSFTGQTIAIGTYDNSGLFLSHDNGKSWTRIESFGRTHVDGLSYLDGFYYAGRYDPTARIYSFYKSADEGATWQNIGPNLLISNARPVDIGWVYTFPQNYLVVSISYAGIYRADLAKSPVETHRFLNPPWLTNTPSDLVDYISAYFDHEYPLLAYAAYVEPPDYTGTTVNFMGDKKPEPELYYSSHSGTDFALPYGTEIKAPANGMARYYSCGDCGNAVKVDHLNGYQTTYMHLQKDGLITQDGAVPVFAGDTIGRVGLTGRTSGPHLHFEVTKDTNGDGDYTDEYPYGRTDPFGWLTQDYLDPWPSFSWQDNLGRHTGTISRYLWNQNIPKVAEIITSAGTQQVVVENKTVDLSGLTVPYPFNIKAYPSAQPKLSELQDYLEYVPGTSVYVEMRDTTDTKIDNFEGGVKLIINISQSALENTDPESLRLFRFSSTNGLWDPLDSVVDLTTTNISAQTDHLSSFAVFGEKIDKIPPESRINIEGSQENGWYTTTPVVTLTSSAGDLDKIFYSLDLGNTWDEYTQLFEIEREGLVTVLYRASDVNGNYEDAKESSVKINISGKWHSKVVVKGASFSTL
jgi:murein DD-endopeptidase MepM/ murein hydrolase activator NlpD